MKAGLQPGLKHKEQLKVTEQFTVPALTYLFSDFENMPPVLATALMIAMMEWACTNLLGQYLEPEERSVGTHVDMSHSAATPVGLEAWAEVELIEVAGRKFRFKATCYDSAGVIGEGYHERFVIDNAGFAKKIAEKAKDFGRV